ncbi:uncharacterized protein DS421_1g24540 [Arachis hypogaea]|nr:uncharacterized protein DS421_1g24540 [Arachis hypogaea]
MQWNGYCDDYNNARTTVATNSRRTTNDGSGAWRTTGRENCYDKGRRREKSRTAAMVLSDGIESGEGGGVFGAERWGWDAQFGGAERGYWEGLGGAVRRGWKGLEALFCGDGRDLVDEIVITIL